MQAVYPASFEREVGCTEAEWLMWLPAALGDGPATYTPGQVQAVIGSGALDLRWQVLSPRQLALIRLPRLAVSFRFERLDDAARHTFMKRFDLYMQRGGG